MKTPHNQKVNFILSIIFFMLLVGIAILGFFIYVEDQFTYYSLNMIFGFWTYVLVYLPIVISLVSLLFSIKQKHSTFKSEASSGKPFLFLWLSLFLLSGILTSLQIRLLHETWFGGIIIFIISLTASLIAFFALVSNIIRAFKDTSKGKLGPHSESAFEQASTKMKELKNLLDSGIITQQEFDEKKKKYIDLL